MREEQPKVINQILQRHVGKTRHTRADVGQVEYEGSQACVYGYHESVTAKGQVQQDA